MSYAELCSRSSFSLLHGASHPEELVAAAAGHGLTHLALTDRDGVYGVVQAHQEARRLGLPLLCGATVSIADRPPVVLIAEDHAGWSSLCRLLTAGRHAVEKGRALVQVEQVAAAAGGLTCLLLDGWTPEIADPLRQAFGSSLEVSVSRTLAPSDRARVGRALALATTLDRPLVATNDVITHDPARKRLADVLTCIRRRTTLAAAGRALHANAERHLLSPEAFVARYGDLPGAVTRTVEVAERCNFRLSELRYVYPHEVVPEGWTPMAWLRHRVEQGIAERYPAGLPDKVAAQLAVELDLVERLDFPSYFLTVDDIVRFACGRGILCQGRGSSANSAICYVLGITQLDPCVHTLLFERFLSEERGEPPDIDVDFEHERREEVIQYIYERYGRERAAMVNEIIAYRPKSAVRDVGKVFGLSLDQVDRLSGLYSRWAKGLLDEGAERVREIGLSPEAPEVRWTLQLAGELVGFPRHLSIHSGGFVIADGAIVDLVPVEAATMEDRTVVQWDKYGVEGLHFVKVDVLALGMLTAIRKAFDLIELASGKRHHLHTVPQEDPAVYEMFGRADTIGVFQIESRAQQSMLPRLKPKTFYDLVIEVALVRPGPIQGGMVHPYLRRRNGEEPITYAHPALEPLLKRTAGVPLFQEQVMAIAVAVGGFSAGKADHLRRAMGAWRKRGGLDDIGRELVDGMRANGISPEFAEQIFQQILGFADYGFPESHAASFALLVYVSGWLKCHHPAAFCAALINSQPMGFYSPRALVGDAQRHGVTVLPVDVLRSDWDCTLERLDDGALALRLGLRLIRGFGEEAARAVERARAARVFRDLPDLARRTGLGRTPLQQLSDAGALGGLVRDRRQAAWILQGLWTDLPLFAGLSRQEPQAPLPNEGVLDTLSADYRATGLSIGLHPAMLVRQQLAASGIHTLPLAELPAQAPGSAVMISGLVSSRQRPGTAKGVVFLALEDETGLANLIVWTTTWDTYRRVLSTSRLLRVRGKLQRQGEAFSVLVEEAWPVRLEEEIVVPSRDFR
jgi:error-prone DNA polymerase